jgi:hypothetical protein
MREFRAGIKAEQERNSKKMPLVVGSQFNPPRMQKGFADRQRGQEREPNTRVLPCSVVAGVATAGA